MIKMILEGDNINMIVKIKKLHIIIIVIFTQKILQELSL